MQHPTRRVRLCTDGFRAAVYLSVLRRDLRARLAADDQSPAVSEWLKDNFYLLNRCFVSLLPRLRALPCLPIDSSGVCRVFLICKAFLNDGKQQSAQTLERFVAAVERHTALLSDEIDALPTFLQLALLSEINRAAERENPVRLGRMIELLRDFSHFDFSPMLRRLNRIEEVLLRDPAGVYPEMDERSRAFYRREIAKKAAQKGVGEYEYAQKLLRRAERSQGKASHVGFSLVRPRAHKRLGLNLLRLSDTAALAASLLFCCKTAAPLLLPFYYLQFHAIFRRVLARCVFRRIAPAVVPRIELNGFIPPEGAVLITVCDLLPRPEQVEEVVLRMRRIYDVAPRGEVYFCLLCDPRESDTADLSPDEQQAADELAEAFRRLNLQYGGCFFLMIRPRVFCMTQRKYIPSERKRGALLQLCGCISEAVSLSSQTIWIGSPEVLRQIRFLLVLDSDTRLRLDTVEKLVGAALHILNRPEPDGNRVKSGYGLFAPSVAVDLCSSQKTGFSRLMSAQSAGLSSYDGLTSDLYQDLFGEGVFTGKGLIDVRLYYSLCKNLPYQRILSHDSVETALLRCCNVTQAQVSDGFPPTAGAYFQRLHRWIRGDVQNLLLTLSKRQKVAVSKLSRRRMTDAVLDALQPLGAVICAVYAGICLKNRGRLITRPIFWYTCLPLAEAVTETLRSGGIAALFRRYYGGQPMNVLEYLREYGSRLLLLGRQARCAADAAGRSLWRMTVSGRRLLEWKTSSEAEAAGRQKPTSPFDGLLGTLAFAACLTGFLPLPAGVVSAAAIVLACREMLQPPKSEQKPVLRQYEAENLARYARQTWEYYRLYVTSAEHFLPPDNVQESPVSKIAHRTSPTNIGLYLCALITAFDLGLIDAEERDGRLRETVTVMERLEKWNGHLYNWYDTRSLKPLQPLYVSTVDSGNLACCLSAARSGLGELSQSAETEALCERLLGLEKGMDFTPLFDREKKLFHIGYNCSSGSADRSYYDLLMSEARMTSYYTIANRLIPRAHWQALSRILTGFRGHAAPCSWSGTAFEYLMPYLFLPLYEGSLEAEAVGLCLHVQQKNALGKRLRRLWGVSESAFYSFDAQLNYQYKANGLQSIALCKKRGDQTVVSPYSSFLALPLWPEAALRNLEIADQLGLCGTCGFYEACDYGGDRQNGAPSVVRSYMAHHVGMSLIALDNYRNAGIWQRRFFSEPLLTSAAELLQERPPRTEPVYKNRSADPERGRPSERPRPVNEYFNDPNPAAPRCHLLSNGAYSLLATDSGCTLSCCNGWDVTVRSGDLLQNPCGVFALVKNAAGCYSAARAPLYETGCTGYSTRFDETGIHYFCERRGFSFSMHAWIHPVLPVEFRRVEYRCGAVGEAADFIIYLEPILAAYDQYRSAKPFSKLFLTVEEKEGTQMLTVSRQTAAQSCVSALAIGFADDLPLKFCAQKGVVLHTPDGIFSLPEAFFGSFDNRPVCGDAGIALRWEMETGADRCERTLLIAAGRDVREAAANLTRCKKERHVRPCRGGPDPVAIGLIAYYAPALFFNAPPDRAVLSAIRCNRLQRSALWEMGIGGDRPLLLLSLETGEEVDRVVPFLKLLLTLRVCSLAADLVITYEETVQYDSQTLRRLTETAQRCDCGAFLGPGGGLYLIDRGLYDPQALQLLTACASVTAAQVSVDRRTRRACYVPAAVLSGEPTETAIPAIGAFTETAFLFPPVTEVPWCVVLANPGFGTLVSNHSLGFTWAFNSQLGQLTPWSGDPSSDNRGEQLFLRRHGRLYSLCRKARVEYRPGAVSYQTAIDGLVLTVTVTVPPVGMCKNLHIAVSSPDEEALEFAYYIEPLPDPLTGRRTKAVARYDGGLQIRNRLDAQFDGCLLLSAGGGIDGFTCDKAGFFTGRWDDRVLSPGGAVCVAVTKKVVVCARDSAQLTFSLSWAAVPEAARRLAALEPKADEPRFAQITLDDAFQQGMFNLTLPMQILNCRMYGRTGFYQNGGAFGFRDQLQDAVAALYLKPEASKIQILRAAAHQFSQGDVLHWWHNLPRAKAAGVRTRYSDDLLWLPYAVRRCVDFTGEEALLSLPVPFLVGTPLATEETQRYALFDFDRQRKSLYEHCVLAVDQALVFGAHGLPLIRGGDWNDGFNQLGQLGKGESVWLGMFLVIVLEDMIHLAGLVGDGEHGGRYAEAAGELRQAIAEHAWDEDRFARAFHDNGERLGSASSPTLRIDLVSQAFAVFADVGTPQQRNRALDTALSQLWDTKTGLLKLLDPPLKPGGPAVGYIAGYPTGIRENGGQYTHAACWMAYALFIEGRADEAWRLLVGLNPAASQSVRNDAFHAESYLIPADISANPACYGRAGWNLYTGAAGWYYRTIVEAMLGIRISGGRIRFSPSLPSYFNRCGIVLYRLGRRIEIRYEKGAAQRILQDGHEVEAALLGDGDTRITVQY